MDGESKASSKATVRTHLCDKGLNNCGDDGKEKLTQEFTKPIQQDLAIDRNAERGERRERKFPSDAEVTERW